MKNSDVMNINTDINILGSISDLNIISDIYNKNKENVLDTKNDFSITKVKTTRSLNRYERAVKNTLILFKVEETKELFDAIFASEELSEGCLAILFLNASFNNDLLDYLNQNVLFPALFSGRIAIKKDEVVACINDLKRTEQSLKKWSVSTIDVTARKYLHLLEKFSVLVGGRNKTIKPKYIDDKQLITFIYWLIKIENKPNILESKWRSYCFLDKETFIKRILEKKFMKYINIVYTGNSMKLETLIPYKDIFNEFAKS